MADMLACEPMDAASPIRCLITAGPTREYFDPVRFISNPSTGKMGYAMAQGAVEAGWAVTLISGPVHLEPPAGAQLIPVQTAEEMYNAMRSEFDQCDILIKTAAVSDYRPKQRLSQKVKKADLRMVVEMEPTIDILKTISLLKQHQLLVGFAAETEQVQAYAREKLAAKRLDYIVANQVGGPSGGFAADDNTVWLISAAGAEQQFGPGPKRQIAQDLIRYFQQHHFAGSQLRGQDATAS